MTKIAVKVVKETKKAKLVQDAEGRQAWVQNRSYKDGLVNSAQFEKGVEFLAGRAAAAAERKEYNDSLHAITADWESEKAVGVDYEAEFVQASSMYHKKRVRVFFPKSQLVYMDGAWHVKGWMLEAKKAEALDKIQPNNARNAYIWA